jgi:histidinol-phosphatase (PHP family)
MLTDYHLHLRPDDLDATVAEYHTSANYERYRAAADERGIAELGVSEHVYRFAQALDIWRHPFWEIYAHDDLDEYCAFVREHTDLRLGIEADFVAGAEDRTANLLEARDFDYVVGSVHFMRDGAVDMDEYSVWDSSRARSAEQVWTRYFQEIGEAARSGLFDIAAHPDLVKYWGPPTPPTPPTSPGAPTSSTSSTHTHRARRTPEGDLRRYYEPAVEGIAEGGIAVEVSTAGLRKPAGEIYPARAFLEMCVDAGVPVALSSDAHRPQDVGGDYERALQLLDAVGVRELCVFVGRQRHLEPIGATGSAAGTQTASSESGAQVGTGEAGVR